MEATPRIELGIKVLQTSALPLGYVALKGGAENEIRTRDPLLGKEVLYHWAISALATRMGLEPTTSAVTGRHSNQLNHRANQLRIILYRLEPILSTSFYTFFKSSNAAINFFSICTCKACSLSSAGTLPSTSKASVVNGRWFLRISANSSSRKIL